MSSFVDLILDQNDEIKRLRAELSAVRACFAEASQDSAVASARIVELEAKLQLSSAAYAGLRNAIFQAGP